MCPKIKSFKKMVNIVHILYKIQKKKRGITHIVYISFNLIHE